MLPRTVLALLTCAVLAATPVAPVPGAPLGQPVPRKLVLRPAADLVASSAMAAGWLVSELALKRTLAPSGCRWCETNAQDLWLSGIRAPLQLQPAADVASGVVGFAGVPLAALGINLILGLRDGARFTDLFWDLVMVMEATLAAMVLTQTVKFIAGRERPFASRLSEADKALTNDPADNNLSFFSGHTSFAFALATAAGTVARLRGYRLGWLAWAVGLPLAALTGLLRMVADKHWFSDVLVGAAVGAATGYFVPTLAHGREDDAGPRITIAPLPMGIVVAVRL